MVDPVDFGDAEAAACDIVRAADAVAAFGDVTVATDLIGFQVSAPWVLVRRTGGSPTLYMRLDNAAMEFAVYAPDKGTARDVAAAARGAVFAAVGVYTGQGLALYDVAETAGLTWAPDEREPDAARYTFTLTLVTRPE